MSCQTANDIPLHVPAPMARAPRACAMARATTGTAAACPAARSPGSDTTAACPPGGEIAVRRAPRQHAGDAADRSSPRPRDGTSAARGGEAIDRLYPAPPALQGALMVLIARDTSHLTLSDAQRLSHFPASPLVTLSWYHGLDAGLVEANAEGGGTWTPFGARVVLSGSQSAPVVSWAPTTGRGYMACFTPDVAHALFGIDPAAIQDRFVPAAQALGLQWSALCDALLHARDDEAALAVLTAHLAPRWAAVQGRTSAQPSLRQLGRHWVDKLAVQAHEWRRTLSPRHVERRVKSFSGRSLRQWQSLVKTEGLFFAARERYEAGQEFDWAALALDEGFADQAHMVRTTRRITGFAPGEFAQRFIEDESFWMYRLWV